MDYLVKFKKDSCGFTLIEMIVVIGIIALLTAVSSSVYSGFKTHEHLEIATMGVVEAVRHAQANAQAGKGDSSWGVQVLPQSFVVFKGGSYAGRDTSTDQEVPLPGGVSTSGLSEIVFEKITGVTVDTGTLNIANEYGTKNISINAQGTLTY